LPISKSYDETGKRSIPPDCAGPQDVPPQRMRILNLFVHLGVPSVEELRKGVKRKARRDDLVGITLYKGRKETTIDF